ncbi:signal transduction histidine kinase [Microbacteriaceae bacterium SG_E_30_P1]|uniref:Signal transduction histidine kinase n=1 Tax=Antiquaquibacter oligotrophicus TaxID=2880260 RepID=A0ABT6KQG0_9MICO|nr:GAF domain-containing protein [Antiquaquibacter oligotrophicus]MDH6182074.1 signal transduction histidine kinase [Antiquaquibacter oligotrophicus]UDF12260.1 GAF domain-containing protein [Antiquaquibacter oligotrophicus]
MDDAEGLTFPDGPRTELDSSLARLVQSAQEVLATQGRLRNLLKATRSVAGEIELAAVLRTIVEAAVDLVGARYGAVGVIGPDGMLEQFIHVGMPDDLVAHIGHLPQGHGLLGALIEEQQPIRLPDIAADPRSSGFPAGHPPMTTFLGVPIRVRGETYGNLYLAEHEGGPFSAEDEELLVALAATAGAAIDHARLFDESRRRERWTAASAEVTAALLSDDSEQSLAVLADRVALLADADTVCVVLPAAEGRLRVDVVRGDAADTLVGLVFAADGTLAGRAQESGHPHLTDVGDPLDPLALGPTMALPIAIPGERGGVLTVSRAAGRPRFATSDLTLAADFAAQASVGLRLASAQADRRTIAMLEDRSRIARDLHDNVIQRLFAAGLSLQALAGSVDGATRARLAEQVDALDAAIADIRTAIFTMTSSNADERPSLRHRVIDLMGELGEAFPESPRLTFSGAVDLLVTQDLADDMVAVLREALSNAARHAEANDVWVRISALDGVASVVVEDDGVGIPATLQRSSGTANLDARARSRGGEFTLGTREPRGSVVRWAVPLEGE